MVEFQNKINKDYSSNLNEMVSNLHLYIKPVPFKEEKKIPFLGSLLELFNSSQFNIHMLIYYLDRREEQGIIDTLINLMYNGYINESFFYLPQLCTMLTYKKSFNSLEPYILDRCINQLKFSLKISWLVSSYLEDTNPNKNYFINFIQRIETTLVNGRRATMTNYKHYLQSQNYTNEEIIRNSINKEIRLEYFTNAKEFYEKLKIMCERLKELPRDDQTRNKEMRVYMKSFNNLINKLREEHSKRNDNLSTNFFKGILLPFDDSRSTLDEYNTLIVRIIPEHCFCFSTKARVLVKILVETVKVIECEDWDLLYVKQEEKEEDLKSPMVNEKRNFEVHKEIKVKFYKSLQDFLEEIKLKKEQENLVEQGRKSKLDESILNEINERNREESLIDYKDVETHFGKNFKDVCEEIRSSSSFRNFKTYRITSFIAKSNDDLRQELMAMQLIKSFYDVFHGANIPLKLRPYEILITSSTSGLIEFIPNSISIDSLKKKFPGHGLNTFFRTYFKKNFEDAQKNFVESLAAYSLVCYLMQIKDRHNGNILIDMNGFIIHIDYGFILSISPGNLNFENAPFKMTNEYLDIMDGPESAFFLYFKSLFLKGLMELKKHVDTFVKIVEIMSKGSKMPCFPDDPNSIINSFRERFHINKSESELVKIVDELISYSLSNWRTSQYDYYQKMTNGIIP